MDPAGAKALGLRLEQQRHWLLAGATSDGRQAHADPDASDLEEIHENERIYRNEDGPFAKRLIDERWERIEIVAAPAPPAVASVGDEDQELADGPE